MGAQISTNTKVTKIRLKPDEPKTPPTLVRNAQHKVTRGEECWEQVADVVGTGIIDDSHYGVHGSLRPVLCDVTHSPACKLEVTFRPGALQSDFWLIGRQGNRGFAAAKEISSKVVVADEEITVEVKFQPPWARKDFPWGFAGDITWELRSDPERSPTPTSTKLLVPLGTTRLEIYGIGKPLPSFYGGAVDVNFLRTVVLPAKSSSAIDWPRHVAKAVFWDFGFRYNSFGRGAARYASGEWATNFYLRRWTRDVGSWTPVNCYDCAGMVQIMLGLGTEPNRDAQIMHLDPYGFINRTQLIGQGFTNNPFRSSDESLIVAAEDKTRQPFGNHTFVRIGGDKGMIIDACAGPHLGTETLEEYMEAAISADLNQVAASGPDDTHRYGKDPQKKPAPRATTADLSQWHLGVVAVNTCSIKSLEDMQADMKKARAKDTNAEYLPIHDAVMKKATLRVEAHFTYHPVQFKLSDLTELIAKTAKIEVEPDLLFNDHGCQVTYDVPLFHSHGLDQEKIEIQIVALPDHKAARAYFERDLWKSDYRSNPEDWDELGNWNFDHLVSLAKADVSKNHGIIVWVRSQLFFRISGWPSSKDLWSMYGEALDYEASKSYESEKNNLKILVKGDESTNSPSPKAWMKIRPEQKNEIEWTVTDKDTYKDPDGWEHEYEHLLQLVDWNDTTYTGSDGDGLNGPVIELTFNNTDARPRQHKVHFNFVNKEDSLKVAAGDANIGLDIPQEVLG